MSAVEHIRPNPRVIAVEIRDPTWLHDDVFEVMRRHGAALCIHDLLADHPFEMTTDWTYVRFHGPDAPRLAYRGRYGARRLQAIAARLERELDRGNDVLAYFNNDVDGDAVADAQWLRHTIDPTSRLGRAVQP